MLAGWRRNLAAFACGVCATLTLPPVFIFPLIIPAYGGLFWLLSHAPNKKRALADGFFWGWGFYITGLYWFCIALLTDPDKFAWMIPFALFGLTAVIALYSAVASLLYFYLKKPAIKGALIFAAVWTAVEFARGHLFSGFPWNLPAYALNFSLPTLQLASLVGAYGLSFIVVLLGACCFCSKRSVMWIWGVFLLATVWGAWRTHDVPTEYVDGVKLRLVQANIQQHHKWDPALQMQGLREHMTLTQSEGLDKITHVIWPETAVPYVLRENSVLAKRLGEILPPHAFLITGALRSEPKQKDAFDIRNSMVMLDSKGDLRGAYDKNRLVPFGEFLPLRRLIPKALQTPVGEHDFSQGNGLETESWQGLPPFLPLICYEVIFPENMITQGDKKPQWLLSITNDAWFGNSSAPYQHLEMARMRAVEQGLPLVRVANTGISAIYDAFGRNIVELRLGEKAMVDSGLPKPYQNGTIFGKILELF